MSHVLKTIKRFPLPIGKRQGEGTGVRRKTALILMPSRGVRESSRAAPIGRVRSRVVRLSLLLLAVVTWFPAHGWPGETRADRQLRVCADPNNLPFTNQRLEGFENRIAELIAGELQATVQYTWWAQRRGFFRNTLNAGACDVVLGVPQTFELALITSRLLKNSVLDPVRGSLSGTIFSAPSEPLCGG
jgi:hypothetical protein